MRRTILGSAALVLLLAACSSNSDNAPSAATSSVTAPASEPPAARPASTAISAEHNDADIEFAQMMMPHHSEAISLADGVRIAGSNPAVKALAQRIRDDQAPEIEVMNAMLMAWGKPPAGHEGHSDTMDMPGMASAADLEAFYRSSGTEIDRLFVTLMIAHHKGAIEMARTERLQGINPQATAMATSIMVSQQTEIVDLEAILATLP